MNLVFTYIFPSPLPLARRADRATGAPAIESLKLGAREPDLVPSVGPNSRAKLLNFVIGFCPRRRWQENWGKRGQFFFFGSKQGIAESCRTNFLVNYSDFPRAIRSKDGRFRGGAGEWFCPLEMILGRFHFSAGRKPPEKGRFLPLPSHTFHRTPRYTIQNSAVYIPPYQELIPHPHEKQVASTSQPTRHTFRPRYFDFESKPPFHLLNLQ